MRSRTKITLLVILLVFFTSVGAVSAQDWIPIDPPVPGGRNVQRGGLTVTGPSLSAAEEQALLAYWTRERILAAQPMEMPVDFAAAAEPDLSGMDVYTGRYGRIEGGLPDAGAEAIARAAYPEAWADVEEATGLETVEGPTGKDAVTGTSQVYTPYFLDATAVQKLFPHRVVGRTSSPSGTCTATSISNNHIVTAAHCVYNTQANLWIGGIVFQPAYRNGNAPYGTFPVGACTVLTAWVNRSGSYSVSWAKDDVAVCNMGNNSAGQTLNNAVGWAGREWNFGYERHFHNLGYPGRNYQNVVIPNAGRYLHACVAESGLYATDIRRMGCNMGPGISGGPWLANYALNRVQGNVSGVNSGIFINQQNAYGARFSSANIVPICNATGC